MTAVSLGTLPRGEAGVVVQILDDAASLGAAAASTLRRRLLELGFVPGATVEMVATLWPSRDPVAVRVGTSTFALRRREADVIRVQRGGAAADTAKAI